MITHMPQTQVLSDKLAYVVFDTDKTEKSTHRKLYHEMVLQIHEEYAVYG